MINHQVLARKWRPRTFNDVMGQQHVLQALVNALELGRLHHAYLFSGTRGVGKTTIARILAKSVNCENGISATPCGQCASCCEIDQGRFVDLLEIDAASRTRVEDTRDILDNVQYKPARGRYKVYLIDEVHMLSRHSFNALLKTLEEPPAHVIFLLATTDPQKLPVTILSRCLQFHLKPLQLPEIQQQLSRILDAEAVTYEPEALSLLSQAADGSVRDALSLTEQALAYGNGAVTKRDVYSMLGRTDEAKIVLLLQNLVTNDADGVMQWLQQASAWGCDYDGILKQLQALLHELAKAQILSTSLTADKAALASELDAEMIQLFYQIASQARKELPYASDLHSGFEMTLLRLLSFSPAAMLQRPESVEVTTKSAHNEPLPADNSSPVGSQHKALSEPQRPQDRVAPKEARQLDSTELQRAEIDSAEQEQAEIISQATEYQMQSPVSSASSIKPEQSLASTQSDNPSAHVPQQIEQPTAAYANTPHHQPAAKAQPIADTQKPGAGASSAALSQTVAGAASNDVQGLLASHHQLRSHRLSRNQQNNGQSAQAQPSNTAGETGTSQEHAVKKSEPVTVATYGAPENGVTAAQRHGSTDTSYPAPTAAGLSHINNSGPLPGATASTENGKGINQSRMPEHEAPPWVVEDQTDVAPNSAIAEVPVTELQARAEHELPQPALVNTPEKRNGNTPFTNAELWQQSIDDLGLDPILRQLLLNATLSKTNTTVQVLIKPELAQLISEQNRNALISILTPLFGDTITISSGLDANGETPMEWQRRRHQEKLHKAKQRLLADPNVTYLHTHFGAELDEDSVQYAVEN